MRRKPAKLTKSIRLTVQEADELHDFTRRTGVVEAAVLKKATLRGLQEERLDHAVLEYTRHHDSAEAAALARLSRAEFLNVLAERGITVLETPSTLAEELGSLARGLKSDKLARAARRLTTMGP